MIKLGLITFWAALVWSTRFYFQRLLESIRKKDQFRLEKLQHHLDQHFVFEKSGKLRKIFQWMAGPLMLFAIRRIHRMKFQKQLLLLLPSLSSLLKSGHGLERSLEQLKDSFHAPMSNEIGLMLKEMHLGSSLIESFQKLYQRFPSENLQMVVHAISISKKLGTSLSQVMDNITQAIMEKEKLRQQIMALTAQGKIQAWIAVSMPFGIAGILQIIAPHYFAPLYRSTIGLVCIGYCLVSMAVGLFWIHKIATKEYL